MSDSPDSRITVLYTNIGRGHPFYLDGITDILRRKGQLRLVRRQTDVFDVSRGLSLAAWKGVRALYRLGASDGIAGRLYSKLRTGADYNRGGVSMRILGSTLREELGKTDDYVLVAHPTLVAMLKGVSRVIYQHGELAAPAESVVRGAEYVLVPTLEAAEVFVRGGYPEKAVVITGLCIEPALVRNAADVFEARLRRINGQEPLTGAFFSSGAEPKAHVNKLIMAARQAVAADGRVVIIGRHGGSLVERAQKVFKDAFIDFAAVSGSAGLPVELPEALVVNHGSRREENALTASLFSRFDYFVAPSHERTNWALGLGLPMFVVGPSYGPFSPLNREILLRSGVAEVIDSGDAAVDFGRNLEKYRQHGALSDMSRAGWEKYDITGFEKIADFLINSCRNHEL